MKAAICVEKLSKFYRLGADGKRSYHTLRETITQTLWAPGRWFRRRARPSAPTGTNGPAPPAEPFWAVRDVSFEVKPGEIVGIIGRNGAGKSTVLKMLSRITEPTSGRIFLRGRVGSLLEVGTGFHPELTGRENIYLNGAILGMGQREIARKFDEIVAFAEVEQFLDTPVKRYSSGMYTRLAFAVAAHLESEILLVDEVLAVGDAAFQKKCLGKMGEVVREGRTVLFVSHNMAAVRNLCTSAVLLAKGRVVCQGGSDAVIARYLESLPKVGDNLGRCLSHNPQCGVTFKGVELLDAHQNVVPVMQTGQPAFIRLSFETSVAYENVTATVGVNSLLDDTRICIFYSWLSGDPLRLTPPAPSVLCAIPKVPLSPGRYRLTLRATSGNRVLFYLPGALEVDVVEGDFYGTGRLPDPTWGGACLVDQSWGCDPRS
jgi:lipopolysaccharide transport system ATP-binding protein